jgi:predicted MFS family arabinose efflux permease
VSNRRNLATLTCLSLTAFCYITIELLPIGLLTVIADDLHRSRSQTGQLVTVYAVVVVIASIPLAHVTQRIPRRLLIACVLGLCVLATALSGFAPGYAALLVTRIVVALTQSLFWSIVPSTAAGLFPPEVRGRMLARFAVGQAFAPVIGVPACTWIGQQFGWRAPFLVMAGILLVLCVVVFVLLPATRAGEGGADYGIAPDKRRFWLTIAVTGLGVCGFDIAYTYVTPFLLDVSHFGPGALGPLLAVTGVAGILGTITVGRIFDRYPAVSIATPLTLMAMSLLLLYALGPVAAIAAVLFSLVSFGFGFLPTALQARCLLVAPGRTEVAMAALSSAFNVGIAGGAFLGGLLVAGPGVRTTVIAGGLFAAAAVAVFATSVDRRPVLV